MNGSANADARLGARALRVRNRCLVALAARRRLPMPTADELARVGDDVSLRDAFVAWEAAHAATLERPTPALPTKRPPAWWQSSRLARAAAIAFAGVLGVFAGTRWLPRARAQSSGEVAAPIWTAVSDSSLGAVNERFLAMSRSDLRLVAHLSAADLAGVIFSSRRSRMLPVDSLAARMDSSLHVRGRVVGGASFELTGDVRLLRRGVAELWVTRLAVDGRAVTPEMVGRVLTRSRVRAPISDRLRFDVPAFVASLRVADGGVDVLKER
jgi:hypothetical protein